LAPFQLEPGPIPFHHQVYLDLLARIEAGDWAVGDRLPPERELAERYGCSLITVRRALADLAREERLERTRGRGTFVTKPRIVRDLTSTFSFAEEMELRGLHPRTELLTARREPASEAVAEALRLASAAPIVFLERRRSAADVPLLLEQVRLSEERFPELLDADLEHGSLYDFLAERYDCHVERLRETLEPILLPSREARLLGQERGLPALLLEGTAFDQDELPIEVSRTFVPGQRSKFLIESTGRWARGLRAMRAPAAGPLEIEPLVGAAAADRVRVGGRRR
jgi:GntR family transcriptional regulator, N-acetylglucosamine utilization regulator